MTNIDFLPLWAVFLSTGIIITIALLIGEKMGSRILAKAKEEKESAISVTAGAVISLLAFMLVFTYGIVYERFENKKALVRDEANIIRTTWSRSDFLPEQDRQEAKKLLVKYVDMRIYLAKFGSRDKLISLLGESENIQHQLWNMASVNAWKDMNSDIAALYIESLNDMSNIQAMRIAVAVQARVPIGIWLTLILLTFIGMFSIGYQVGITGSGKKSVIKIFLIISFALIITQIASLDRSAKGLIRVSQQPLEDLRTWMLKDIKAPILNSDTTNNTANK